MQRVALRQIDLFSELAPPAKPSPVLDPRAELAEMLAVLRRAERMPWPDAAGAMADERRALGLAKMMGPDGQALADAILVETERLLALADEN